jgi:sugar phosphate isomerase/epimerase
LLARIALQLHSLRDEASRDLGQVLERVAEMGYLGVELGDLFGVPPEEFRRRLDEMELQLIGSFGPWPPLEWPEFLDQQQALRSDVIVVSLMPDSFESRDSVARAAEKLNENAAVAGTRGLSVLYHNHPWELRPSKEDGSVPFWEFVDLLDPQIGFEPDIYWAYGVGVDPVEMLTRLGQRVRRMHVKDGPGTAPLWPDGPADLDPQLAVGSGVLDIPAALAAAPQADWHVVEFDQAAGDIFEALNESYRYLTGNGLSTGRI